MDALIVILLSSIFTFKVAFYNSFYSNTVAILSSLEFIKKKEKKCLNN